MPEISTSFPAELALECLAEALQTMAFVGLEPPPEDAGAAPPGPAERYAIRYDGALRGEVLLAAPRAFGRVLASNMLAVEPESAAAEAQAGDAMRELCNVTTGLMLRRRCEAAGSAVPEMGLPTVSALSVEEWKVLVAQEGAAVALAEGYPLALVVKDVTR